MKLEPFEKETIITFNEEQDFAVVYTRMRSVMKHMLENGFKVTKEVRDSKDVLVSREYQVPVNFIKLPKLKKVRISKKSS